MVADDVGDDWITFMSSPGINNAFMKQKTQAKRETGPDEWLDHHKYCTRTWHRNCPQECMELRAEEIYFLPFTATGYDGSKSVEGLRTGASG